MSGSKHLRIGRASDLNPCTILHAIARKAKSGIPYRDTLLISNSSLSSMVDACMSN